MSKRCGTMVTTGVKGLLVAAGLTAGAALALAWPASAHAEAARVASLDPKADAQAVIDRALKVFANATTYSDAAKTTIKFRAKNAQGEAQNIDDSQEVTFAFAQGRKVNFAAKDIKVVSDGTTLSVLGVEEKTYVQKPLADKPDVESIMAFHSEALGMHPIAQTAVKDELGAVKSFPFLSEITSVEPAALDGRPGKRVSGKGRFPGVPVETLGAVSVWFADDTGLPGQIIMDGKEAITKLMADMIKQAPPELAAEMKMTIDEVLVTVVLSDVKLNTTLAEDTFTFKPAADAKKADSLAPSMGGGDEDNDHGGSALAGQPAPEIAGKLVDGSDFKLSDLKGKVVLLDFWAMWCGPCVAALPSIQKLHEEYKDKGVVVIGMNNDGPDDTERLKKFLADKKVTFGQFPPSEKANEAYKISAFPTMILIGKDGTVQDVAVGFGGPDALAKKKEKLDKLLKGESLAKPADKDGAKGEKGKEGDKDAKPAGDGMGG